MKQVRRYDNFKLDGVSRTPSGFLRAPVTTTRTGIFNYRQADGSVLREYRPDEEVFDEASIASMRSLPATAGHPKEMVNSKNAKELMVGYTTERVDREGDHVGTDVIITDENTITRIEDGYHAVSLGYVAEMDMTPGEVNGERYDAIQRKIRYNHLAVAIAKGRAGPGAKVHLDADDAEQIDNAADVPGADHNDGGNAMAKVKIDSVEYEASEALAGAAVGALNKRDADISTLNDKVKDGTRKNDELQAKLDAVTAENTKLKAKADDGAPEKINAAVKARVALISAARKRVDEETAKKLDEMTDRDIKIAVIKSDCADFKADGKSDDYVNARFDHCTESVPDRTDSDLEDQLGQTAQTGRKKDENDPDQAREKSMKADSEAWLKPLSNGAASHAE